MSNMKNGTRAMNIVVYHKSDFDGIFCREIAKRFVGGSDTVCIGWTHGEQPIQPTPEATVYILDLPPSCVTTLDGVAAVWIDHHKTSIDNPAWKHLPGYRIDGVAACRLVWQWFNAERGLDLPTKSDYTDRRVGEPWAVRMVGERDVWDKRDPNVDFFNYGLMADGQGGIQFGALLDPTNAVYCENTIAEYISKGKAVSAYAGEMNKRGASSAFVMEWHGLKFLAINSATFNSETFALTDVPETGHDALLGFCYRGPGRGWRVGMFHAKHRNDIDLSAIAAKFGGGGHAGACGFVCQELPFRL